MSCGTPTRVSRIRDRPPLRTTNTSLLDSALISAFRGPEQRALAMRASGRRRGRATEGELRMPDGRGRSHGSCGSRLCDLRRRQALATLLDPEQHLAFHHEGSELHRQHPDASDQARKPEPVAADEAGPSVSLLGHERPDPVAVVRAPGEDMLWVDALDAHPVGAQG